MVGTKPRGYATVEELETHLDVALQDGKDRDLAQLYLRSAEDAIAHATGGRLFLPVKGPLAEAVTADALTLIMTEVATNLPEGGHLLIDSEVLVYGALTHHDGKVHVEVLERGVGGTTAATHEAGAVGYMVKGLEVSHNGQSLYPGDFLDLKAVWVGDDIWTGLTLSYMRSGPRTVRPYQWIQYGSGWEAGVAVWVAAVWGYAWSVPADIKRATLRIAEEAWLRRGNMTSVVRVEQAPGGAQTIYRDPANVPKDVASILFGYSRIGLGG